MLKINKEDVYKLFENLNTTTVYIATSLKNLQYYEYILNKKGVSTTFLKTNTGSKKSY